MPKMKCRGPKGTEREISWPPAISDREDEKSVFSAIRDLLEDNSNLTLTKESDILVLSRKLTRLLKD